MMRLMRIGLMGCVMVCAMALGAAAQDQPSTAADIPPAGAAAPAAGAEREWVPEGVVAMGRMASGRTEFTLDHTILKFATMLDRNNPDLKRVVAGVNGVSVHIFRFPAGIIPDPGMMASIDQQYQEAGWMHLVKKHRGKSGDTTDLWVRLDGASIRDVAVLMVRARQVDFISESGSVAPLDLMRLSGHFGIPQMDGGVAVPVPGR
jgi:hypothetical protein